MRAMKDSGIQWVGKIPVNWNVSKMKFIGEYINGYAFKPTDWTNRGKPIIRIQDLTGNNNNTNFYDKEIDNKYLVKSGDILVSWAATLDSFIWDKDEGWLNQHIFKANPNKRLVNKKFFFWLLKIAMDNMNNDNKHGIVMQHVTLDVFNNFKIVLPFVDEQQKIAEFLDEKVAEIDEVIEKTKETIEDYKKYKQSIITEVMCRGINLNAEMKNSNIEYVGKVPASWNITKIKHIANVNPKNSITLKPEDVVTYTPMECIKNGYYIPNYGLWKNNSSSYNTYIEDDIVMAKVTPCFENGNIAIMNNLKNKVGYGSSELIVFRKKENILNEYLLLLLQTEIFKKKCIATMTGTGGLKRVSKEFIKIYSFYIPSITEQQKIVDYLNKKIEKIMELIKKKEKIVEDLEEYKKSLIYEYVTGKKQVI